MASREAMPIKKETGPPAEIMRGPFLSLRDEIDRVFDEFMSWSPLRSGLLDRPLMHMGIRRELEPAADIIEKADRYEIDLDVPGVKKGDIEIGLSDTGLTVRCKVNHATEEKGEECFACERRHESFTRSFTLPEGVDAAKISADLEDGVLTITMPKTPEARKRTRRIEVKTH